MSFGYLKNIRGKKHIRILWIPFTDEIFSIRTKRRKINIFILSAKEIRYDQLRTTIERADYTYVVYDPEKYSWEKWFVIITHYENIYVLCVYIFV